MYGFTDNYIKVAVPFNPELVNQLVDVQLECVDSDGVMAAGILAIA